MIIIRKNAPAVVMMSLEANAIEETGYLLRSPTNAARLRKSMERAEKGKIKKRKLIEPKE